jgi:hypothetical protein
VRDRGCAKNQVGECGLAPDLNVVKI